MRNASNGMIRFAHAPSGLGTSLTTSRARLSAPEAMKALVLDIGSPNERDQASVREPSPAAPNRSARTAFPVTS
jgi:hypothetical protein